VKYFYITEIVIGFARTKDNVLEDAGAITVFVEVKNSGLLQRDIVVSYSSPALPENTAIGKQCRSCATIILRKSYKNKSYFLLLCM